jgi:galactose-1-phosphate uridylyltransferase
MNQVNYTKIFLVVLFAVLIASITTGIVFKVWIEYEARVAIEQASLAMQKSIQASKLKRARIAAELKLKAESKKRQLERQKLIDKRERKRKASIRKTNLKTCNFWKQAYSKENNGYNKAMLDSACKRAMSL